MIIIIVTILVIRMLLIGVGSGRAAQPRLHGGELPERQPDGQLLSEPCVNLSLSIIYIYIYICIYLFLSIKTYIYIYIHIIHISYATQSYMYATCIIIRNPYLESDRIRASTIWCFTTDAATRWEDDNSNSDSTNNTTTQ